MKNLNDIQKIITEIGEKIDAPKSLLTVFSSPQPDAAPYIKTDDNQYLYIIEERGKKIKIQSTESFDLLIYWLVKDIVFYLSTEYELNNRQENKDSRRIIFEHELQLFRKINTKWSKRREEEIESTLSKAPYEDM